jgi:hypothetical protein
MMLFQWLRLCSINLSSTNSCISYIITTMKFIFKVLLNTDGSIISFSYSLLWEPEISHITTFNVWTLTSEIVWTYLKVILQISGVFTEAWKQGPNLRLQEIIAVVSNFISLVLQSNTTLPVKQFKQELPSNTKIKIMGQSHTYCTLEHLHGM